MNTFAVICAVVTVAASIGQLYVDASVSRHFPLYVSGEKTKWLRGKDGYYSLTRHLTLSAAILGGGFATSIWWGPWAIVVFGGPFALIMWIEVWRNRSRLGQAKAEQFAILRQIKKDPENAITYLGSLDTIVGPNVRLFKPFWDIRVPLVGGVNDPLSVSNAVRTLVDRFRKLAAKPESEWWKLDRSKSL